MPYITREDGIRFVIPSYRDVLSTKKVNLLKQEILLLAQNYGNYVVLQKKTAGQFEIALSPDQGYLLGETVWHYFKRPFDLIYCEQIPNTSEAILVVVKSGNVYIDGSFPLDSIVDELLIFKTQQNNFDIYISGDVPISEKYVEGKFSLDKNSIRSFQVLPEPIFQTLPTVRAFELQPVDAALRSQGIGALPVRNILIILALLALGFLAWRWITSEETRLPTVFVSVVNPYQVYLNTLTSPDPAEELKRIVSDINLFLTVPGWVPSEITYERGIVTAAMHSLGARTEVLMDWATHNRTKINATTDGFIAVRTEFFNNRLPPATITRLDDVIAALSDKLTNIIPGNALTLGTINERGPYREVTITITFSNISVSTLDLLAQQLQKLPLVLTGATITLNNGGLSGSILLLGLGT